MKILVTGANGQLGTSLRDISRDSGDEYIFTDVDSIDITDPEAVRNAVTKINPDVIVNCAAYTNVEKAEDDERNARKINSIAPGILAEAAENCGAVIIHISTDYVYGGKEHNTPIIPDSEVSPIGVYGKTKAEGEDAVKKATKRHIIIRTAWLYSEYGHNFVKTMSSLMSEGKSLKVVEDQTGSPTYASDLAKAIVTIIASNNLTDKFGTYNFTDEGVCSWYDFAMSIREIYGYNDSDVSPCATCEYPTKARRPAYSVLSKKSIKETFGVTIPYWRDSLKRCISNIQESEKQ